MNKQEHSPKSDSNSAKKSPTNFVRKTSKLAQDKKSPLFENQLKKESGFLKRPNESWDY